MVLPSSFSTGRDSFWEYLLDYPCCSCFLGADTLFTLLPVVDTNLSPSILLKLNVHAIVLYLMICNIASLLFCDQVLKNKFIFDDDDDEEEEQVAIQAQASSRNRG